MLCIFSTYSIALDLVVRRHELISVGLHRVPVVLITVTIAIMLLHGSGNNC